MAIILLYQASLMIAVGLEVQCLEVARVNQKHEAYGYYIEDDRLENKYHQIWQTRFILLFKTMVKQWGVEGKSENIRQVEYDGYGDELQFLAPEHILLLLVDRMFFDQHKKWYDWAGQQDEVNDLQRHRERLHFFIYKDNSLIEVQSGVLSDIDAHEYHREAKCEAGGGDSAVLNESVRELGSLTIGFRYCVQAMKNACAHLYIDPGLHEANGKLDRVWRHNYLNILVNKKIPVSDDLA